MLIDPESKTPFHSTIPSNKGWDVISLSLVLNFVPDPQERGQMLRLAHAMLAPDGLLFVVVGNKERSGIPGFIDPPPAVATTMPSELTISDNRSLDLAHGRNRILHVERKVERRRKSWLLAISKGEAVSELFKSHCPILKEDRFEGRCC